MRPAELTDRIFNPFFTTKVTGTDLKSDSSEVAIESLEMPNGLCFSPDEKLLYVNDTVQTLIRVFDVAPLPMRAGALLSALDAIGRLHQELGTIQEASALALADPAG